MPTDPGQSELHSLHQVLDVVQEELDESSFVHKSQHGQTDTLHSGTADDVGVTAFTGKYLVANIQR